MVDVQSTSAQQQEDAAPAPTYRPRCDASAAMLEAGERAFMAVAARWDGKLYMSGLAEALRDAYRAMLRADADAYGVKGGQGGK